MSDFEYKREAIKNPSVGVEGDPSYEHISLIESKPQITTAIITFGMGICFGDGHSFGQAVQIIQRPDYEFLHQQIFQPQIGIEGSFQFTKQGLSQPVTGTEGDFRY